MAYLTDLFIAEHPLNAHDLLRVEICNRRGKYVTRISRWKRSAGKICRTGESFEFGAKHTADLIAVLALADTAARRLAALDRSAA
jgi:hypothetical protein